MIKDYKTSKTNNIKIVKYDGSEESIQSIKELCKIATDDNKEIHCEASIIHTSGGLKLSIDISDCEGCQSIFYAHDDKYVVYDSESAWELKIVICEYNYIMSKYGINMLDKITRVTFPNQSFHDEVKKFCLDDFVLDSKFDDCVFGKWKGVTVKVNREDYNELIKDKKDEKGKFTTKDLKAYAEHCMLQLISHTPEGSDIPEIKPEDIIRIKKILNE